MPRRARMYLPAPETLYSGIKRLSPVAFAYDIDGSEHGATRNDPALKPVLAGKIDQYQADDDSQDTLPGQNQHCDAEQDNHAA